VFEEVEGLRARIVAVGVSVFVQDSFVRELKTPPLFWFGAELTKRILRGDSPLLTDRELREANSRDGVNLLVWEACVRPEDAERPEIYTRTAAAFVEEHLGFFWKEIIGAQADIPERLESNFRIGAMAWNPADRQWAHSLDRPPQEIFREPHVFGVTRDIARRRPGSWLSVLFDYHTPQFGFSRGEQRLLQLALGGGTDEELSNGLGVSLSAVKRNWRTIYDRAAACLPELVTEDEQLKAESPRRGKQKKQRLLDYLRKHPEELRPVSRRLLQLSRSSGLIG